MTSKCDDEWKDWENLSDEEKKDWLEGAINDAANDWGYPAPTVSWDGTLYGWEAMYSPGDNSIEFDSGFDLSDRDHALRTGLHESAHAAENFGDFYDADHAFTDDIIDEMGQDMDDRCDRPPYEAGGEEGGEEGGDNDNGGVRPPRQNGYDFSNEDPAICFEMSASGEMVVVPCEDE